ncbi:MAG: potassium channel family protein [Candidatus Woesearchaeota archaeon]
MKKKGKVDRSTKSDANSYDKLTSEDVIDIKLMEKGEKLEGKSINKIKKYLHIHFDNYESHHGRRIEGTLFIINFLAIALFIIDTHTPTGVFKTIFSILEIIIISIFIVEYLARMWVAEKKVKHFFNIYSLIDLVAILPILVQFANLAFFRVFRILRLFRMLRVLRFQRIFKSKDTMFGKINDTQLIIIRISLTIFTIILISSGLIWTVENSVNPGQFGNIWETIYFVIVTLATVGYGDITPISPLGKVITVLMIISGIALIPWQLGKLIKVLIMEVSKTKIKCHSCKLEEHDTNAVHCNRCGAKLKKKKLKKTNILQKEEKQKDE